MLKLNNSELPTLKNENIRAVKIALYNHYINHKLNSNKTVLENIINSFGKNYLPERYFFKSYKNSKIFDDTLQDIRSLAHLIVWEATDKYLWGSDKKKKIRYKEKFDFCIFASEQVKFKLRTQLRVFNLNRICGKLPDSDEIRNIYTKLPKLKKDNKYLDKKDYQKIANENNIKLSEIKLVDNFITAKTDSGDEKIKNEYGEDNGNKWDQLEIKNSEAIVYNLNLEEKLNNNIVIKKFNILKNNFLETLSVRDKEILNNTKFSDLHSSEKLNLTSLGKKFNLSSERIRQISEKKFSEFSEIVKKNKKDLEIN